MTSGLKALKGGRQENKELGSGKAFGKFELLSGKHKPIRWFFIDQDGPASFHTRSARLGGARRHRGFRELPSRKEV